MRTDGQPNPAIVSRLTALPAEQQQAILSLAGGVSKVQTARTLGISYRTMLRWSQDDEFESVRREISAFVCHHQVRAALEAFFDVMEQDRANGEAHNARWFLNRTLFADFERSKRAAGAGPVINLNVSQNQARAETEAAIAQVWRQRLEEVGAQPSAQSAHGEAPC